MPRGLYMVGMGLTQNHKDARTCYHCKKPGYICVKCPDLKKKKGSPETKQPDGKKKWYNTNSDNKATMSSRLLKTKRKMRFFLDKETWLTELFRLRAWKIPIRLRLLQ